MEPVKTGAVEKEIDRLAPGKLDIKMETQKLHSEVEDKSTASNNLDIQEVPVKEPEIQNDKDASHLLIKHEEAVLDEQTFECLTEYQKQQVSKPIGC